MNNIIETEKGTMIMSGGDPLEGCPENFNIANKWADTANIAKDKNHEPIWSFDCGFKLDFDGPILEVSSRFYPPKTHYGPKWDGTVSILLLGITISRDKFECDSLELRSSVESHVKSIADKLAITNQL